MFGHMWGRQGFSRVTQSQVKIIGESPRNQRQAIYRLIIVMKISTDHSLRYRCLGWVSGLCYCDVSLPDCRQNLSYVYRVCFPTVVKLIITWFIFINNSKVTIRSEYRYILFWIVSKCSLCNFASHDSYGVMAYALLAIVWTEITVWTWMGCVIK